MLFDEIIRVLYSTFAYLQVCVDKRNCRLFIPTLGKDSFRISEGEIRSAFIEQFLKDPAFQSYSYSIETPTELCYRFSNKSGKRTPSVDRSGRKANIDACIIKDGQRMAIIEFKANNTGAFEHGKDFFKLYSEPGQDILRFFVEVYSSTDSKTLESIHDKLYNNNYFNIGGNTHFLGYSIKNIGTINNGLITCNPNSTSANISSI